MEVLDVMVRAKRQFTLSRRRGLFTIPLLSMALLAGLFAGFNLVRNDESAQATFKDPPKLKVVKTAAMNPMVVGQTTSFSLKVTNNVGVGESSTSSTVTVQDTFASNFTLGTMPSGCSASGQVVTCTTTTALNPNNTNNVTFVIPVTPNAASASVTNTAKTWGGGDTTCTSLITAAGNCISSVTVAIKAPVLHLTKTASTGTFVVGTQATYILTVQNSGNWASSGAITVQDAVPAGLTIGALPSGCSASGQVVTCTSNTVLNSSNANSIVFAIPVTPTAPQTTLVNTAKTWGGGDATCKDAMSASSCSGSVTVTVKSPELRLTKTASVPSFVVGVPASYSLKIENTGTWTTSGSIVVKDTIPANLTIGVLPASCSAAGQVVTCTITVAIAAGGQMTLTIPVTPTATGSTLNTAYARGGGDPVCLIGTPDGSLPLRCVGATSADVNVPKLSIAKTSSVATVVRGVPFQYTLDVTNAGSVATTVPATVSDTLPVEVTVDAGALPVGCSAAGQIVTCTIPVGLAVGAHKIFVLNVTSNAQGGAVSNTVLTYGGGDSECTNAANAAVTSRCNSTVVVQSTAPVLSVAKDASLTETTVGSTFDYTVTVSNTGNIATTEVSHMTDSMPAGLGISSINVTGGTATCSFAGQEVDCEIPAGLGVGGSVVIVIHVVGNVAGHYVNSADVTGGGDVDSPVPDTFTAFAVDPTDLTRFSADAPEVTVFNLPTFAVTKTASVDPMVVGQQASYILHATNVGEDPLAPTSGPITFSDTIPDTFTIGVLPADCSASGQVVTCTTTTVLQPNDPASFAEFVIPVTPTVVASDVPNRAFVFGGGSTMCAQQSEVCSGTATVDVVAPELTLAKVASADELATGQQATYTLTVTNNGTTATTGDVVVVDLLAPQLDVVEASLPSGCTWVGSTRLVVCTSAAVLQPGDSISFVITVVPNAQVNDLTNVATVRGGGDTFCALDLQNHQLYSVELPQRCLGTALVDLTAPVIGLTKIQSVGANARKGDIVQYTLTVANNGDAPTAGDITVQDVVPAGIEPNTGTLPAGCTYDLSLRTITCTLNSTLAVGASEAIVISATVVAGDGLVTNTAYAFGGGDLACVDAASAAETQRCSDSTFFAAQTPFLGVTKVESSMDFVVGSSYTYAITVANHGNVATNAVTTMSDTVPSGLAVDDVTTIYPGATCGFVGQVVTCEIPTGFAVDAAALIIVHVTAEAAGSFSNTAYVFGGGDQDCPAIGSAYEVVHCQGLAHTVRSAVALVTPADPADPIGAAVDADVPGVPNTGHL